MHYNRAERNELTPVFNLPKYNLWEEGETGFIKAYINTLGKVLFYTRDFFSNTTSLQNWLMPLLFGVISDVIGLFFRLVYYNDKINYYSSYFRLDGIPSSSYIFIVSPFMVFIGYLIFTLIFHSGVFVLGGKGGINKTLRVFTYSSASSLFYALPYLGGLLALVFRSLIIVRGLKIYHEFSTGRAISSLLLPLFLFFFLFLILVLLPFVILGAGTLKELLQFIGALQ